MGKKILVSVIMCVYNTKRLFLEEAVKSIVSQTLKSFELIIVDDGSETDLYDTSVFEDERIVLIKNKKNIGVSAARNIGIKRARGKYISFMDSDDIAKESKLEKQVAVLESNSKHIACSCWYKMFYNKEKSVHINLDDFEEYRCKLFFKHSPSILPSTFMVRSKACKEVMFDENLRYAEDWKFFAMISEKGSFFMLQEELLLYRVNEWNLTSTHKTTKNISNNTKAIGAREYVKGKIGLSLSRKEDEALYLTNFARKIWPRTFMSILKKILKQNSISRYYDNIALRRVIQEKWKEYIKMINNPIKLLAGIVTCPFSKIPLIKIGQIRAKWENNEI